MKELVVQSKVRFEYILNDVPPRIEAVGEGLLGRHVMYLNGACFWVFDNGTVVPMPYCPYPDQILKAQRILNWSRVKTPVLIAGVVVAALILHRLILLGMDGASAELSRAYIDMFTMWMNIGLFSLGIMTLIMYAIPMFFRAVKLEKVQPGTLSIGAGAPDISPDILVVSEESDNGALVEFLGRSTDAQILKRIDDAMQAQKPFQLIVVIFRAQDIGYILHPDEDVTLFRRNNLETDLPGWQSEISPTRESFYGERWDEFNTYISLFASRFRTWSASAKMNTENPIQNFKSSLYEAMKRITITISFFALFAGGLFAQPKTVRVKEYLGEAHLSIPEAGKKIDFRFEEAVFNRVSDGKKSFKELLVSPVGFSFTDNDAGNLLGIYKDGVLIPKARPAQVVRTEATSAQPVPPELALPDEGSYFDSAKTVQRLRARKALESEAIRKNRFGLLMEIGYWEGMFWKYLFGIGLVVGAILWFWGALAATESAINQWGNTVFGRWLNNIHTAVAGSLYIVALVIGGIFLFFRGVDILLSDMPSVLKAVVLAAMTYGTYWVFQKIIPNKRIIPTSPGGFKQLDR